MFVADAHCDTLYEMLHAHLTIDECKVTPARLKEGGVGIQTFALFAGSRGMLGTPYADGIRMLDMARTLPIRFFTGELPPVPPEDTCGIFSIEGGEILEGSLDRLYEFDARARIRLIALTWNNENEIGCPAKHGAKRGLKPFGRALLAEMDRLGIYADVSHLNEAGFWEVVSRMSLPPVASHSDVKALTHSFRNLNRDQILAIIARGGFIGINFYPYFLTGDKRATLDDALRHIDAIAELGGVHFMGFGSDFDGIECWPDGLETPADFPALIDRLLAHGYTQAQVEGIAGRNYYRLLKRGEAARAKI